MGSSTAHEEPYNRKDRHWARAVVKYKETRSR